MWHKIRKTTPPQHEIVWLMLWGGVEIMARHHNGRWEHPDGTRVINEPTHWKRMGT